VDSADQEDLWDFGTVRHGGRPGTIGRNQNSVRVPGPPLTWENDEGYAERQDESIQPPSNRASTSFGSSVAAKATSLPPLPPSPATSRFEQSTVRHMPPQQKPSIPVATPAEQQHQDAYEDYDDQYVETYSTTKGSMIQQKLQEQIEDDDLPDTTMLDSVILPAIASVSYHFNLLHSLQSSY
jgi:serine/threonine-protein kinase 24/25/MST4